MRVLKLLSCEIFSTFWLRETNGSAFAPAYRFYCISPQQTLFNGIITVTCASLVQSRCWLIRRRSSHPPSLINALCSYTVTVVFVRHGSSLTYLLTASASRRWQIAVRAATFSPWRLRMKSTLLYTTEWSSKKALSPKRDKTDKVLQNVPRHLENHPSISLLRGVLGKTAYVDCGCVLGCSEMLWTLATIWSGRGLERFRQCYKQRQIHKCASPVRYKSGVGDGPYFLSISWSDV